jgi:hypothetical protein
MATNAAPDPSPAAAEPSRSVIAAADPLAPRRLSEEFALILKEFEVETVTLREVLGLLQGRGFVLLLMLLALPFCTPVPLPGLSTPFGATIALIGLRLACAARPWLPDRLLDTRLPPAVFTKVFAVTRRLILGFERLLRPRLLWLTASARLRQLHAVPVVLCALLLLLPLPVPFSNTLPSWGILLIAGGLLARDGAFIIAGYFTTLLTAGFFALLGFFGLEGVDLLWQKIAG